MIHNFQDKLKLSHQASDHPIWETLYQSHFPNIKNVIDCRSDMKKQRLGIDREIILHSGKIITVDEKIRTEPYRDIALEYISVDRPYKAGWVEDCSLQNDYISYAVLPLGTAYFLPLIPLQNAWGINKDNWIEKYPKKKVLNEGWNTFICCVPKDIIFDAIKDSFSVNFDPIIPVRDIFDDFI